MSSHPLGHRMDDDVCAMIEAPAQIRCVECGIDHQRDLLGFRYFADGLQVHDVQAGIANEFSVDHPGVVLDGVLKSLGIGRIHECCVNSKTRQGVFHQADVAAVHLGRGNDVVSLPQDGG